VKWHFSAVQSGVPMKVEGARSAVRLIASRATSKSFFKVRNRDPTLLLCWRGVKDEEQFMSEARKWSNAFLTYCGVAAALVICSSVSLALVINAGAGLSHTAEIEKTLLDYRVESSREIRQALSKPIPRPEPLGPITAKLARSLEATTLAAKPKLSKQAADAFASADLPTVSSRTNAVPDRHSSNF